MFSHIESFHSKSRTDTKCSQKSGCTCQIRIRHYKWYSPEIPMKDKFFLNVTLLICTAVETQTKVSLVLIGQFSCLSSCKDSDLAKVIDFKETDCSYSLTRK